ncbi:MAG: tetratricopeptide repeat protein [bacterium]
MIRNNIWKRSANIAFLLFFLFLFGQAHSQNGDNRATRWFQSGLAEKDPQKKIEAYQKALDIEPLFVEALYNLGLVYMQLQENKQAEENLNKALKSKPDNLSANLHTQILYYLAITEKRLNDVKEAEAHLREAKKIAPNKTIRSRVVFDLGRILYKEKRVEEALTELKAGASIDPKASSNFRTLISIIENEIELEQLYAKAESQYARGHRSEAAKLYRQIATQDQNYRDVRDKIATIEAAQQAMEEKAVTERLFQQALTYNENDSLEKAIETYEKLLQRDPDFPNAKENYHALLKKYETSQMEDELKREYLEGISGLKNKNWTRAIIAFEKILLMEPNYLDARKRLEEANRSLEREDANAIIGQYYSEAIKAIDRNDLGTALAFLEKVRLLNPSYKKASKLISKVEDLIQSKLSTSESSNKYVEGLYKTAIAAMEGENWMEAILTLEKLRVFRARDPEVLNLLSQARASQMAASGAQTNRNFHALSYTGLVVTGFIAIPIFGFILFAPRVRARFFLMTGKHLKASQIYERMLIQRPDKVKLYIVLAKIYLLMGKNDERAVKVYHMLINLNLAANMHQEIRRLLTERYLDEPSAPTEAIAVLESALKSERAKQNGNEPESSNETESVKS